MEIKRQLSDKEIENILDFIQPQEGIPYDTAMSVVNMNKERFRKQLINVSIYPNMIPELKKDLFRYYRTSLIQTGESVGVICAQSVGEKQTQATLNSFHHAGISEKTTTTGVPRFLELINATKKPRLINHTIYFTGGNSTIQETRNTVGHSIVGLTLSDVSENITIELDKEDEVWYDAHKILFGDEFSNYDHCVSFKLNMKKLFDHKLTMQQIADRIHEEYDDLYCVFSPPGEGKLDVFVDTTSIILPKDRILFIDQDNAVPIYLEECVQATLEKMYICGIPAITEIFYTKQKGEWFAETNGFNSKNISKQYSSFQKLLAHPSVDYTRTISNHVWDIYEVLDVEAARQFLVEEFMSIMDGINACHTMLLVDRMTHSGTISSISRYTLKTDDSGVLGKASFEETLDHLLNAAAQGQRETTKGVSASIICGKRAIIGTNMSQTTIDIPKLPIGMPKLY